MGVTVKRRCPLPSPTPGCRENERRHNEIEGACAGLSCVMRVTAARGESWGLESRGADRILRDAGAAALVPGGDVVLIQ